MTTANKRHRKHFAYLLERSPHFAGAALGLLLLTLLDHRPSTATLISGTVLGLAMLLMSLWLCRTRHALAWLVPMLFPALFPPLITNLGFGDSWWSALQLPLVTMASYSGLVFLFRRWLFRLARL